MKAGEERQKPSLILRRTAKPSAIWAANPAAAIVPSLGSK